MLRARTPSPSPEGASWWTLFTLIKSKTAGGDDGECEQVVVVETLHAGSACPKPIKAKHLSAGSFRLHSGRPCRRASEDLPRDRGEKGWLSHRCHRHIHPWMSGRGIMLQQCNTSLAAPYIRRKDSSRSYTAPARNVPMLPLEIDTECPKGPRRLAVGEVLGAACFA